MITPTLHARSLQALWRKEAVRDVRLAVGPGEVGLGPNGAGKTTTFNMIVGRVHPRRAGSSSAKKRSRICRCTRGAEGITYLPQGLDLPQADRGGEHPGDPRDAPLRRSGAKSAKTLLGELDLLAKRKQKGATLSGGERRRVEITRALVLDPRFMLLDEPFSGIDPIAVIDIQKIISQLRERGIGIVITDHNVRETLNICDRAYIIKDGRIIREGSPAEITEDPTVREIYLGQNFRL
jgi:lipopolysaccharide export system ATP-binding protein